MNESEMLLVWSAQFGTNAINHVPSEVVMNIPANDLEIVNPILGRSGRAVGRSSLGYTREGPWSFDDVSDFSEVISFFQNHESGSYGTNVEDADLSEVL